jgi:hypothetical protein
MNYSARGGTALAICTLEDIPPPQQDIVSLLDLMHPFLHDANEVDFESFVGFMGNIKDSGNLWITGAS